MERTIARVTASTLIVLTACVNAGTRQEPVADAKTENLNAMNNLISIAEIPASDLPRAIRFYQNILGVSIEEATMGDTRMGVFPADGESVSVVLVHGADYKPTTDGAVLYLNAGDDLQPVLDKVEQNGGQVIVPKTEISPEMGYFAIFLDTEGNKLGLHSSQ